MTTVRELAEAISDGINCMHMIWTLVGEADAQGGRREPVPEWVDTVEAMERALEAIIAGAAVTSWVIRETDVERVRRVRVLISEWIRDGHPAIELATLIKSIFDGLGLSLDARAARGQPGGIDP